MKFYQYQGLYNLKNYFKDSQIYYICNKNFPDISFYNKDLNMTFILYNIFLFKKGDYNYFLIVFVDFKMIFGFLF
jgi:hypothetical protein